MDTLVEVEVSPVWPNDVMDLWPDIEKHLHEANEFNDGRVPLHHWLAKILVGAADLLAASDMEAACICEVVQYPTKKVYQVVLYGGKAEYVDKFKDACTKAAKIRECGQLEMRGRPGWRLKAKQWGSKLLHCHWVLDI